MKITADIRNKQSIALVFDYDLPTIQQCKALGGTFAKATKKRPAAWLFNLDLDTAQQLRRAFGDRLTLTPDLAAWGRRAVRQQAQLAAIRSGQGKPLATLRRDYAPLYQALHLGPVGAQLTPTQQRQALQQPASYQMEDAQFLTHMPAAANLSEMGTGKTLTVLAAMAEHLIPGPHLVVAPLTSLNSVWRDEASRWLPDWTVIVVSGTAKQKREAIAQIDPDNAQTIVVTNPATVRLNATYKHIEDEVFGKTHKVEVSAQPMFPGLAAIGWGYVVFDEFHLMGLANPKTLTSRGAAKLKSQRRLATSGTPMGGQPVKLFGMLTYLDPVRFTSKWKFVQAYLDVETDVYGYQHIGGVRHDCEEDFYKMLSGYVCRRTKAEVLPWLPPIQRQYHVLPMTTKQTAQYDEFAREAEIRIDELELTAVGVLAEYTRLKQFANAECDLRKLSKYMKELDDTVTMVQPVPQMAKSNKTQFVLDTIEELGIPTGDQQLVVFSQFVDVCNGLAKLLLDRGIPTVSITGAVTGTQRDVNRAAFQQGEARVICVNTKAGGVAITLDRASTVIFMDETWNPDDQDQAESRCHRASRIHQVTVHYLQSQDTVEDWIRKVNENKAVTNYTILDARSEGFRA